MNRQEVRFQEELLTQEENSNIRILKGFAWCCLVLFCVCESA